jgi:energy-coupling factor transporter ATP-binding protein EcfA2
VSGDDGFDVFLSYARGDGAAAAELNSWLRDHGLRTFFDRNELRPGLPWVPALEEAINRSRAVAILFGKHGIGNTQQYERQFALVRQTHDAEFPVVPVLMPGYESPPTGFLQLLTWVDLSKAASVLQQPDSLASLRAALRGEAIKASTIRAQVCPYRGLEPFREEDAPFFCGRDDAIRKLVAKMQAHVFVAVVGASGSGKSSLVFAGLLPALRKESQTRTWDVVSFRPGKSPLGALAAAFGTAPEAGPAEIDAYLEREAEFYRTGDTHTHSRASLIAVSMQDRKSRIGCSFTSISGKNSTPWRRPPRTRSASGSIQVMLTNSLNCWSPLQPARGRERPSYLRADFYNPLVRSPLISALLPQQQVNIPLMGSDDLQSAIETPAKHAGLSFSPPELVDQILNDVGSQEGRLPPLQFALKETWERRKENRLTAEAYTAVGGVIGAIEKSAESVYNRLTPAQQDAARRLFLRLVTPGEGQEDTRARSIIPDDPQQLDVINLFSDPKIRLLVTGFSLLQGSGQAGGDVRPTVEVAHEALIQRWPTLKAWVNGNREKLRARAAILRAMAEWNDNGRADRFLLDPGVHLERGRALIKEPGDVPVDDIRDFVNRSIKREEDRLAAESEAALAEQKRIARELRRRVILTASTTAIAVLGLIASLYAWSVALKNESIARLAGQETQYQLDRANQALAAGILADMDLKRDSPLTVRQRNALWKLATADEAVRALFISALSASGEEIARIGAGFGEVSRSLGLQWPSPVDAEKLLATAVVAVNSANSDVLQVLAAKLTEEQAQQALAPLLQLIGKTSDSDALGALAKGLRAVAARLTEAQAQQALAPLLQQQIGKTTDPNALQTLAGALQALAAKLTETQARQALDALLQQMDKTTDPDALQTLAMALQALPAKLTERQAQQALAPLLQQIGKTSDPNALGALAKGLQALAAKLTEAQAQQALAPLLKQIAETNDPNALRLHAGHGLSSFFDVHDIPAGLRFHKVLLQQVKVSAVVAIHTDSYSSREWCRREIIEAKRWNVPLVVANCISDLDERGFPYLGNVPIVRMDSPGAGRIDVVIGHLLDEVLKDFLWRCRVELVRATADPAVVFVPRSPELISLASLPALVNVPEPVIVYPDRPLSAEEEQLFEEVAPHVRLRSLTEWLAGA